MSILVFGDTQGKQRLDDGATWQWSTIWDSVSGGIVVARFELILSEYNNYIFTENNKKRQPVPPESVPGQPGISIPVEFEITAAGPPNSELVRIEMQAYSATGSVSISERIEIWIPIAT